MTALAEVTLVAGLVTAVAPFAQARRILRRRSSEDVSLTWLCLYGAGCLVWIAYGISVASVPLVASQSVAAAGSAAATFLAIRWRRPEGGPWRTALARVGRPRGRPSSSALRVGDVMLRSASLVSEELVVDEARRSFFGSYAGALPVVDHAGRAVGIVSASNIAALPPLARASCLVARLAGPRSRSCGRDCPRRRRGARREAVVRTGIVMVTDRRHRLTGVAWCLPPMSGEGPEVAFERRESERADSPLRVSPPRPHSARRAPLCRRDGSSHVPARSEQARVALAVLGPDTEGGVSGPQDRRASLAVHRSNGSGFWKRARRVDAVLQIGRVTAAPRRPLAVQARSIVGSFSTAAAMALSSATRNPFSPFGDDLGGGAFGR